MEGIQCLERCIYERPLTSEPFIENQSEHISKLSLHQSLVKRKFITKRYRRAREPSRISLRFLRRLKNKSTMLKKFLFKRISSIFILKSSKLHRYVKTVLESSYVTPMIFGVELAMYAKIWRISKGLCLTGVGWRGVNLKHCKII